MQDTPVRDIMTQGLITANMNQTVSKIAQIFKEKPFHHIPIVNDGGSLKGIISLTDFERIKSGLTLFRNPKIESYNAAIFKSLLARDIMTKDVIELRPSDTIEQAYQIFKKNKFRALPITEKGKLIGIVTPLDMLDYFFTKTKTGSG